MTSRLQWALLSQATLVSCVGTKVYTKQRSTEHRTGSKAAFVTNETSPDERGYSFVREIKTQSGAEKEMLTPVNFRQLISSCS